MEEKIEWQTKEFEYEEKGPIWFSTIIIIALILGAWAFWTKNMLFVFIVLLGCFLLVTYSFKKPKNIKISINDKGIEIDSKMYDFEDIRSFWIFEDLEELSIRYKSRINPYIRIPIGNQNQDKIKEILKGYIPEKKHKITAIDSLEKLIRF